MKNKWSFLKTIFSTIFIFIMIFAINTTRAYATNEGEKETETIENVSEIQQENLINATDVQRIKEIIGNDINTEDINNKVEQGYTTNEIIKDIVLQMPIEKKISIATKAILENEIVRTIITIFIMWIIYTTIIRWIIYIKAGRHGWEAIIPIYRQIVMYQICDLNPALMLLWFIPILGWIVMLYIAIVKRFALANAFGRGVLFGFGLLVLPPVFQGILALNPYIEYENLKSEKEE